MTTRPGVTPMSSSPTRWAWIRGMTSRRPVPPRCRGMIYTTIDSPVGLLLLAGDGARLSRLAFLGDGARRPLSPPAGWQQDPRPFASVRRQLDEYFEGSRRTFDIPLALDGTEWEQRVWQALLHIPYGETRSYG